MKVLPIEPPTPRDDRPSTQLLHDEPNLRVVGFHLQAGQLVPSHKSTSTVLLQVISGAGTFCGAGDEVLLNSGDSVVYEPDEEHSIQAEAGPLHFLAMITPRPG